MIIDMHTHTFPAKIAARALAGMQANSHSRIFSDGTAEGLRRSMGEAGIDYSLNLPVATSPSQVEHINDTAARINEGRAGAGLLSFASMHPDYGDWRGELARIKDMGLRGIKLHPVYQHVDFDDIRYLRILERCAALGLAVVTHAGIDIGIPGEDRCSPPMVAHALHELGGTSGGDLRLVLAHMGGWYMWDQVAELLAGEAVMLDTSISTGRFYPLPDGYWKEEETLLLDDAGFLEMVRAFGPGRVLFGSDSPWTRQDESVEAVRRLPLAEEEKEKILGGNAAALLGLA